MGSFQIAHGNVLYTTMGNSSSTKNQIKYFVYCMENAIMNLPVNQEQMVWLIDFDDFSLKNISVAVTRDTAHVLQEHYPERLSVGVSTRFLADKFPLVRRHRPLQLQQQLNQVENSEDAQWALRFSEVISKNTM